MCNLVWVELGTLESYLLIYHLIMLFDCRSIFAIAGLYSNGIYYCCTGERRNGKREEKGNIVRVRSTCTSVSIL